MIDCISYCGEFTTCTVILTWGGYLNLDTRHMQFQTKMNFLMWIASPLHLDLTYRDVDYPIRKALSCGWKVLGTLVLCKTESELYSAVEHKKIVDPHANIVKPLFFCRMIENWSLKRISIALLKKAYNKLDLKTVKKPFLVLEKLDSFSSKKAVSHLK